MTTYFGLQFEEFCNNIRITDDILDTIQRRYHQITSCINAYYWDSVSDTNHSLYVGSFGRGTSINCSDVDIVIDIPYEIYHRFNNYSSNGPSALLQDLRSALLYTYPQSGVRGDGQVVSINFTDGVIFEIVPAFKFNSGAYDYPDSNDGGSWRYMDPRKEISEINLLNKTTNRNLKRLCRMIRAWNSYNSVFLPGHLIDASCFDFMKLYKHNSDSYNYYDEICRDYFKYMLDRYDRSYWYMPGSNRQVKPKYSFYSDAKDAYELSIDAIQYQNADYIYSACKCWRDIFGTGFPLR